MDIKEGVKVAGMILAFTLFGWILVPLLLDTDEDCYFVDDIARSYKYDDEED